MDKIDRILLELVQKNARLTAAELAEAVSLSPSPVARRLRQLEADGLIEGYRAQLNKRKLGLAINTFVQVRLKEHQDLPVMAFEDAMRAMTAVISCYTVSGAFDYLLHVVTPNLDSYEMWVRQLQRLPMVSQVDSSFAIREVKANDPLPIP
ncbi:Lrp/AsnC family transcriptional regulator [Reinekea sp.]|jgi:DNA-binding Lrp family transcriptional regulator|uniref:Lrp/AsnC family transcriptional regulator n=1 Tax=Reinekea sp. TaxID=1970455 RepID=UPI002A810E8C|nr:Lrp/AsnC family transcriptional regulator [Reinekea sp.]